MAVATDHYFESCGKTTTAIDNSVHCKTRVKIEQMFRIWKSRYTVVFTSRGGGGGDHDMSSWTLYIVVIVATTILHNICIVRRLLLTDDDDRAS